MLTREIRITRASLLLDKKLATPESCQNRIIHVSNEFKIEHSFRVLD